MLEKGNGMTTVSISVRTDSDKTKATVAGTGKDELKEIADKLADGATWVLEIYADAPYKTVSTNAGEMWQSKPLSWWDRLKARLRGEAIYTGGDFTVYFVADEEE
jgi:hypothetical protein